MSCLRGCDLLSVFMLTQTHLGSAHLCVQTLSLLCLSALILSHIPDTEIHDRAVRLLAMESVS